jgi:hypothetical protein
MMPTENEIVRSTDPWPPLTAALGPNRHLVVIAKAGRFQATIRNQSDVVLAHASGATIHRALGRLTELAANPEGPMAAKKSNVNPMLFALVDRLLSATRENRVLWQEHHSPPDWPVQLAGYCAQLPAGMVVVTPPVNTVAVLNRDGRVVEKSRYDDESMVIAVRPLVEAIRHQREDTDGFIKKLIEELSG